MTTRQLLDRVVDRYANSRDANGLPVAELVSEGMELSSLRNLIVNLRREGQIDVVFGDVVENPHIRRLPAEMVEPFNVSIEKRQLDLSCLYPSKSVLSERLDLTQYDDEPFRKRIWAGEAQLKLSFFDLTVLEKYRNDPRYELKETYFGGSISTKSQSGADIRQLAHSQLRRFGIGFDKNGYWVLGAMLRDLRHLSPSDQRIWLEHERHDECKLNEARFQSWIVGSWSDYNSIYDAFLEEPRLVNEMTEVAFGHRLFKKDYSADPPSEFGLILRPTCKAYYSFAVCLDKMLSDNIDPDFFESVDFGSSSNAVPEGTLGKLAAWLDGNVRLPNDEKASLEIVRPMKNVRSLRSKASHIHLTDAFDHKYEKQQQELIESAYKSLMYLRADISKHPKARQIIVPKWIFENNIRVL